MMPAKVPFTGMWISPARVVPGIEATVSWEHSTLTSTSRPLASLARSCDEGAQGLLSPVRADLPNVPPEYFATTGRYPALPSEVMTRTPVLVAARPMLAAAVQVVPRFFQGAKPPPTPWVYSGAVEIAPAF